jgi:Trk K+ transport system NAD-binding subunit
MFLLLARVLGGGHRRHVAILLGVSHAISADQLIAHTLAKSLEAPHAGDMIAELVESDQHSLTEIKAGHDTVGRPLSAIRAERAGLVLGLVHDGRFHLGIGEDPVVASGGRLLLAQSVRGHAVPSRTGPQAAGAVDH